MTIDNKITVITCFFDIGRSDWTADKGLPGFLQRTTDTYFERFAHLATLDNPMVIYTSEDFSERVAALRVGREEMTKIVVVNFKENFLEEREIIKEIQNDPKFIERITPSQRKMPEYWNADYVLVNYLKSTFVNHALSCGMVDTDLVSWIDYGYCRDASTLGGHTSWSYDFDKEKIHVFAIKDFKEETMIETVIANNDVYITGPCIVAAQEMWPKLFTMMQHQFNFLTNHDLVDDDQTLLLMCTLGNPSEFQIHKISHNDWFVVFKDYNDDN